MCILVDANVQRERDVLINCICDYLVLDDALLEYSVIFSLPGSRPVQRGGGIDRLYIK